MVKSINKFLARAGLFLGACVVAVAFFIIMWGNAILSGYLKGKVERAFGAAHPGWTLHIGHLDYSAGANRLIANSVFLKAEEVTVKVASISLTGVNLVRLHWKEVPLPDLLAKATLEVTNLIVEFPGALYGLSCSKLRACVPDSELFAQGMELQTLVQDEAFFASQAARMTRYHVVAPECRISGVEFSALLQGKSCFAKAIHFSKPTFDALVNREKPSHPFVKSPLMVHEALALIPLPVRIDTLNITNGTLTYCERVAAGAAPGVLTFGAVNITADGIANQRGTSTNIELRGQADFMNSGVLKVMMTIPVASPDLSLHYFGTLSVMDLTMLNAYLERAEHLRIKSGNAQEAAFDMTVTDGRAIGHVRAIYGDLVMAVLDNQTGAETGLGNRLSSFVLNTFKINNANARDAIGFMREGKADYTRQPEDSFTQVVWFGVRSGVLDILSN